MDIHARRSLTVCLLLPWFVAVAPSATTSRGSAPVADFSTIASERTVVLGDIAHYRFDVVIGPGAFDVVRMHRVVRESEPHRPVRSSDAVFLLPGAPNFFESIFMPPLISSVPERDRSVAMFLARHDIDVWGMDYGWALVPPTTTDFGFMKNWGVEKDAQLAGVALSIARSVRGVSGQDPGPFHLLGFSYGVSVAWALAGAETLRPASLRHVKGIIPVDSALKCEEKQAVSLACSVVEKNRAASDKPPYESRSGVDYYKRLGDLAAESPDGRSEISAGLNNLEALMHMGASSRATEFHFVAGEFDEKMTPKNLRYTELRLWMDLNRSAPPYLPAQIGHDRSAACCGTIDVPFDDRLGDIAVPILYVGAAGGAGEGGAYTARLTRSKDVTTVIVRLQPDRKVDFGHADLFLAKDAERLVWRPILDWIKAHGSMPAATEKDVTASRGALGP